MMRGATFASKLALSSGAAFSNPVGVSAGAAVCVPSIKKRRICTAQAGHVT